MLGRVLILGLRSLREWGVGSGEWGVGSGEWGVGDEGAGEAGEEELLSLQRCPMPNTP